MTWSARKKIDELERENAQLLRLLLTFYDMFAPISEPSLDPKERLLFAEAEQVLTIARKYGLMDESHHNQNGDTI